MVALLLVLLEKRSVAVLLGRRCCEFAGGLRSTASSDLGFMAAMGFI